MIGHSMLCSFCGTTYKNRYIIYFYFQNKYNFYSPINCSHNSILCNAYKLDEVNGLLPKSQHGFRAQRSTMSALTEVQQKWAINTETKEVTGILLWDLSAAFDCLDSSILCDKLREYGVTENSIKWFNSFLTNRKQRVRIDDMLKNKSKCTLKLYRFDNFVL